jgi:hypothetical protein
MTRGGSFPHNFQFTEEAMSPSGAKLSETLHQEVANQLRFGGIPKDKLDELVAVVAQIYQQGMTQVKIFPKGRPAVDSVAVSGLVSAANLSSVLTNILTKVPRYTGVVIFPYGIVNPETFQVNVQFGGEVG